MIRADILHPQLFDPVSTYRIQFHKDFTFSDFEQLIPYFKKLGVRTIYASPIFTAVPGSTHGYDIADPQIINPEVGTFEQLKAISEELKKSGISWLQDIVPNHMAVHPQNKWLMDVLENGPGSSYASYFDIQWDHEHFNGKLMLPLLTSELQDAVSQKKISVFYNDGRHWLKCYDYILPLNGELQASLPQDEAQLDTLNNDAEKLNGVLTRQHYVLCHWRKTEERINYRRFFTVSGLIALNMQHEKVFHDYHKLINQLLQEKIIQGLRVDHIDGLYDPTEYLYRLREMAGDNAYVIVEKILQPHEALPDYFPVQGTTGYDFLGTVNNLFANLKSKKLFSRFYRQKVKGKTAIEAVYEKKRLILNRYMNGELENLYVFFKQLALTDGLPSDGDRLKRAIGAFLIYCPVYRYYGNKLPLRTDEANAIRRIFDTIRARESYLAEAVDVLEAVILKRPFAGDDAYNDKAIKFYQRCMQLTGPLMAKGVEDTLMYTYNRFIAPNDVGNQPKTFGADVSGFHETMSDRLKRWNYTLNATATHDTKRGEDVRARLNVLSDIGADWTLAAAEWMSLNGGIKIDGIPDVNDEYFIYQSLIGCYPMPGQPEDDFPARFQAYILKAMREAKIHTDWAMPNEAYEQGVAAFIDKLFDKGAPFFNSFQKTLQQIVDAGIVTSLSQVLLKCACPGVPDFYQGGELWDLNMVDPDNRRPVDYTRRIQWLDECEIAETDEACIANLWKQRYNGKIKLWLIQKLLAERNAATDVFSKGYYQPLHASGKYKNHVVAFARWYRNTWYVIIIPRHIADLAKRQQKNIDEIDWDNTKVTVPSHVPLDGKDLLSSSSRQFHHSLNLSGLFTGMPVAIIKYSLVESKRAAGILLPVFSLPSSFGIGDYGKGAMAFADFLYAGKQKFWQILPLNPAAKETGFSPYSSISSMAGNPMLISPELLSEWGLLDPAIFKNYEFSSDKVDYISAEKIKNELCEQACNNFFSGNFISLKYEFKKFCEQHWEWLDDYALFVALKSHFGNKPWYEWPGQYKKRDRQALNEFAADNAWELQKIKWLQFVITVQWNNLRAYCNGLNIKLFGDLAFYVSYDSVATWCNPEIFSLDEEGNMTGIAGVPPDYFSSDGQLWNMPTYKWDILRANDYKWWLSRLERNLQMFDVVRLDHFRAFAEYWEVPAGEKTARNGKWLPGPGTDFFNAIKEIMHDLPFVAEDLGYNMERAYMLRNKTGLPGMKVLQFAWGTNMPVAVDTPHNYTPNCYVYTGTHDNNTTIGWYKEETSGAEHDRIFRYCGIKVTAKNVHKVLTRLAYASIAEAAIVPIQDILGLDGAARMNVPGSDEDNWQWRLPAGALSEKNAKFLSDLTQLYNRD